MTTATDHARSIFAWLEGIAADPDLPATASRLAIVLTRYINRQTGDAWPSIPRLAGDLSTSENTIRAALKAMQDRGHLAVEIGGGRAATNRYSMVTKPEDGAKKPCKILKGKEDKPLKNLKGKELETLQLLSENPSTFERKPFRKLNPNHNKNHLKEPSERERLSPVDQNSIDQGFETLWSIFPRPVAKLASLKAWRAAIKAGASPYEIIEGARRYAAERDREPDPEKRVKFTAHPATWLNGRRWLDTPAPVAAPATRAISPRQNKRSDSDILEMCGVDIAQLRKESGL